MNEVNYGYLGTFCVSVATVCITIYKILTNKNSLNENRQTSGLEKLAKDDAPGIRDLTKELAELQKNQAVLEERIRANGIALDGIKKDIEVISQEMKKSVDILFNRNNTVKDQVIDVLTHITREVK
jgi:MarR-like DNA-binding transcriptional regulator SgrR of sgrS sRNA